MRFNPGKLKELRATFRLPSQKALARELSEKARSIGNDTAISKNMISLYEAGLREPSAEVLVVLCEFFRVKPGEFFLPSALNSGRGDGNDVEAACL